MLQIEKKDERHFVVTTDKDVHQARAIIITAGVAPSNRAGWNSKTPKRSRKRTFIISSAT
ncbi:hypothetical protein HMSSN036_69200 [Paenibacillus macerans]|nr:hypothetical protein HMSSN036_69200 [Paenibacillus macerans]